MSIKQRAAVVIAFAAAAFLIPTTAFAQGQQVEQNIDQGVVVQENYSLPGTESPESVFPVDLLVDVYPDSTDSSEPQAEGDNVGLETSVALIQNGSDKDASKVPEGGAVIDGSDADEDAQTTEGEGAETTDVVLGSKETGEAKPAASENDVTTQTTAESKKQSDGDACGQVELQAAQGRWFVGDLNNGYGVQRYWYGADGTLAADRLIDPDAEGSGWWAFATNFGYVVRGVFDTGRGTVYLASNDGVLVDANGWLVTGEYTGGALQRYYIDEETHAARSGYFSVDGSKYYGVGGQGYVARGGFADVLADNDGKLASNSWAITDAFGDGLQRYWFDSDGRMAIDRLIDPTTEGSGWWAYATSFGYVLRGAFDTGRGMVYLANNDGVLASKAGWLVTGEYTGGALQRYYIDAAAHAARSGYFTVNGSGYFGLGDKGYVLRGAFDTGSGTMYLANNDGVLAAADGWLITGEYTGGALQRYYIDTVSHAVLLGFFTVEGLDYFGLPGKGYVLRNAYVSRDFLYYGANNDGVLQRARITDNMGIIYQNPELPAGCESVALTMVLQSLGFNLGKTTIADHYMPYSSWNFTDAFQGSPYSGGGILAPGLITTANNFLGSNGSFLSCVNLSNSSFEQLVDIANDGTPVLIWTTMYMGEPKYSWDYVNGYQWYYNEHCVVLCGSANGGVRIFDSLSGEVWRNYNDFSGLYYACGSMAAAIL